MVIKLLLCYIGLTLMNHKLYSSLRVQNESIKPICLTWWNSKKGGNALVFKLETCHIPAKKNSCSLINIDGCG
jgi:hypothetical protein